MIIYTEHKLIYKGNIFVVRGIHHLDSGYKMVFTCCLGDLARIYEGNHKSSLREILDDLISSVRYKADYAVKMAEFKVLYLSFSVVEKITNSNFFYAKFISPKFGYELYWKKPESCGEEELVGGCSVSEWEKISKTTGKENLVFSILFPRY